MATEFASGFDITAELAYGENSEVAILRRWTKLSSFAKKAKTLVKTPSYAAFDFLMLDSKGPAARVPGGQAPPDRAHQVRRRDVPDLEGAGGEGRLRRVLDPRPSSSPSTAAAP
jgi:hypothetical protein